MTVITLGGQTGGGALMIGPLVTQALDFDYVDRAILHTAAQHIGATVRALYQKEERLPTKGERLGRFLQTTIERSAMLDEGLDPVSGNMISPFLTEEYDSPPQWPVTRGHELDERKYIEGIRRVMQELALKDNVVIVGRGGSIMLREMPNVLRIGMVANWSDCVQRVMERDQFSRKQAEKAVIERDKARAYYYKRFFGVDDPDKPELYHLVINTSDVTAEFACDTIVRAEKALKYGKLKIRGSPTIQVPVATD